jgi:hypothetical protein
MLMLGGRYRAAHAPTTLTAHAQTNPY